MRYTVLPVPPDLRCWFEGAVLLTIDGPRGCTAVNRFPALLGGTMSVVLQGALEVAEGAGQWRTLPGAVITGPMSAPLVSRGVGPLRCVSVSIRPAATACLAGEGGAALTDRFVALSDLWGSAWAGCEDRMHDAKTAGDAAQALFAFLRARLQGDTAQSRHARMVALQAAVRQPIPQAVRALGWSERHFERVFAGHFGLRPKLYQRIARMQWALLDTLLTGRRGVELALRHGYYDQAHLARDMRLLAGEPLARLVEEVARPVSEQWPTQLGTQWATAPADARPR